MEESSVRKQMTIKMEHSSFLKTGVLLFEHKYLHEKIDKKKHLECN